MLGKASGAEGGIKQRALTLLDRERITVRKKVKDENVKEEKRKEPREWKKNAGVLDKKRRNEETGEGIEAVESEEKERR
jgi:hypothetical protein